MWYVSLSSGGICELVMVEFVSQNWLEIRSKL